MKKARLIFRDKDKDISNDAVGSSSMYEIAVLIILRESLGFTTRSHYANVFR